MNIYKIFSKSGIFLGEYMGKTELDALDKLAKESGYRDYPEFISLVPGSSRQDIEVFEMSKETAQ